MDFSTFGEKFTSGTGISSLMDDLGSALGSGSDMIMMGGGNPAHIPKIQEYFKTRLSDLVQSKKDFQRLIGIYDPPQGNVEFIHAICDLLNREYSWDLKPGNIAITNGSQAAFFMLFNLLAGEFSNGIKKHIQLPIAPEYIGYSDTGISSDFFRANKPAFEQIDTDTFKYHVDFEKLAISEQTGAICVSRPTNPTGNVLSDKEMTKLDLIAKQNKVPLIIDGAYGTPFPNLIFTEARPLWNSNIILCLSLSKFGLPAARTGIVIADQKIVKALSSMNAVLNLASGSFGSLLATDLMRSGEILTLSTNYIRPYYLQKAEWAENLLKSLLSGITFSLHKVEGAMFLWLWLKNCPVTNEQLYLRLKVRGVLIVSGHHFFPGFNNSTQEWAHKNECLRITYSQDKASVEKGLRVIADEIHKAYQKG